MADWTQLPKELLDLIYKHLENSFDLIRFRSVCSSWRSAATPKRRRLPGRFPTLPDDGIADSAVGFYLSKRTIFLIQSPESHNQTDPFAWLVKIEEDIPDRKHLLNPLSRRQFVSLPEDFPRVLDLSRFRVCELDQEFVFRYVKNTLGDLGNLYMEKVAVMCLDDNEGNDFVLLTIHVSGKLAVIKYGEKTWTVIRDMPFPYDDVMPSPFDDVILFKGQFYAVDSIGRTVIVDSLSLVLTVIANPVFGGDKKFLVESCGELLLVDMYLSIEAERGSSGFVDEYLEHLACYMVERTVRFKVFRLDEERQMWAELMSLDNRVLFVGDDCTFSASACDMLSTCKGNCVFFTDNFLDWEENGEMGCREIGVFDLESGNIGPLGKYPEYSKLFWPPPHWVTSTTYEITFQSYMHHVLGDAPGLQWTVAVGLAS